MPIVLCDYESKKLSDRKVAKEIQSRRTIHSVYLYRHAFKKVI